MRERSSSVFSNELSIWYIDFRLTYGCTRTSRGFRSTLADSTNIAKTPKKTSVNLQNSPKFQPLQKSRINPKIDRLCWKMKKYPKCLNYINILLPKSPYINHSLQDASQALIRLRSISSKFLIRCSSSTP